MVFAKKKWGQNFLVDNNLLDKIIKTINITDNETTLSNGVDLVFYNDCTKASLSFNRKEISQTEKLNEVAFWLEFGGFGSKAESKLSYSRVCSS